VLSRVNHFDRWHIPYRHGAAADIGTSARGHRSRLHLTRRVAPEKVICGKGAACNPFEDVHLPLLLGVELLLPVRTGPAAGAAAV